MLSRLAIFIKGLPIVASSPASAYFTNMIPSTGDTIRHFEMRSSKASICASRASALLLMAAVFLSRVERVAESWLFRILMCASMSSYCFWVAAPSLSIFFIRISSLFCFAICSRNDATCAFVSGRLSKSAESCADNCLC